MIFFLFLLKMLIVGTRWNRLAEAVLKSTHNLQNDKSFYPIVIRKGCEVSIILHDMMKLILHCYGSGRTANLCHHILEHIIIDLC